MSDIEAPGSGAGHVRETRASNKTEANLNMSNREVCVFYRAAARRSRSMERESNYRGSNEAILRECASLCAPHPGPALIEVAGQWEEATSQCQKTNSVQGEAVQGQVIGT